MIRTRDSGQYYCDGRECGYPLALGPTGEFEGEWEATCLDCGSSMYVQAPAAHQGQQSPEETKP